MDANERSSRGVSAAAPVLTVAGLHAFYGESHVLHGINFEIRKGEVVALLGRNGAGKTSTLRAIMGLISATGSIRFGDTELVSRTPEGIARLGIGYVPEERGIFASLSVEENLFLPPVIKPGGMDIAEIYALFPNLSDRRKSQGTKLSGGEQQMLAIARILRTGADLILLDEPTEGLAPVIVEEIGKAVQLLIAKRFTVLLVEQNLDFARSVSDRYYVIEEGHVIDQILAAQISEPGTVDKLNTYLGV